MFHALLLATCLATPAASTPAENANRSMDRQFQTLADRYLDQFPALSPVSATALGDHRFDSELDDVSDAGRERELQFCRRFLDDLAQINVDELSRPNQVDYALLKHHLEATLWRIETLQAWAWNPTRYTGLAGSAVYNLLARDFAPLKQRLVHVADRLEQFPRMFRQIRVTLVPKRVPRIHAETAVKQNRGVLSILDNMVLPHLDVLDERQAKRLKDAIDLARKEVQRHQEWLEKELLPHAEGDFRLGAKLYDKKLALTLQSPLSRQEIRQRANERFNRVRNEMYDISKKLYQQQYPLTRFPDTPSKAYQQAIIRTGLERAYATTPDADRIVEEAKRSLAQTTQFVRDKGLVTVPSDPLDIIVMPEFQRGVSLAYCDSPGPLDVGQKTFYAVSPPPASWSAEQVKSHLREYNLRSLHTLTIHEAMPGHFLQLAHSNRYPGKLRAVLSSGVFIEGWAVYAEMMMCDEGFLENDPLMRLIVLKWYLRDTTNALIDQMIHAEGATRDEVMHVLVEDAFQEEREAAGKWTRAQLTSAQLSTYFVGYLEHVALRHEVEDRLGDRFDLKTYHDQLLSYGSPPVKYVRAFLLDLPIPR